MLSLAAALGFTVVAVAAAFGMFRVDDDGFCWASRGDVAFSAALAAASLAVVTFCALPAVSLTAERVLIRRDLRWCRIPLAEVIVIAESTGPDRFVSSIAIFRGSPETVARGDAVTTRVRAAMRLTWRDSSPGVRRQADALWAGVAAFRTVRSDDSIGS